MKVHIIIIAVFCSTIVWLGISQPSAAEPASYVVMATAYTCEAHPRNPMHPCGPLRWGGNVYSPGMACPVSWRGRTMQVPGYGVLRCDDTARVGTMRGLPHIDVRVSTLAEARRFGMRRMVIYPANGVPQGMAAPGAAAPVSAPGVVTTEESAILLAHKQAPSGDKATAMARLLRASTAQAKFPWLFKDHSLPSEQPLWVTTLWVPPTTIPTDVVAQPRTGNPVAAQLFVFDAKTGNELMRSFVSYDVVEMMGWLSSEQINLSQ